MPPASDFAACSSDDDMAARRPILQPKPLAIPPSSELLSADEVRRNNLIAGLALLSLIILILFVGTISCLLRGPPRKSTRKPEQLIHTRPTRISPAPVSTPSQSAAIKKRWSWIRCPWRRIPPPGSPSYVCKTSRNLSATELSISSPDWLSRPLIPRLPVSPTPGTAIAGHKNSPTLQPTTTVAIQPAAAPLCYTPSTYPGTSSRSSLVTLFQEDQQPISRNLVCPIKLVTEEQRSRVERY